MGETAACSESGLEVGRVFVVVVVWAVMVVYPVMVAQHVTVVQRGRIVQLAIVVWHVRTAQRVVADQTALGPLADVSDCRRCFHHPANVRED